MAFGARWETKEGTFWCLVFVQILLNGCLVHNRRSASPYRMASGATWDFQGGLQASAGEDIRWRLVQDRTLLKKGLVHERLVARPK